MNSRAPIGVMLVNLGTPDAPTRSAVGRYLTQFLLDDRVIDYSWVVRQLVVRGIIVPFRSGKSAKLYRQLWTKEGSPIKVYGNRLQAGVQEELGTDYCVELAMRYQKPSIPDAIQNLREANVRGILVFPLFPQYASATTGSIFEEVGRVLHSEEAVPKLRTIHSYPRWNEMVDIFVEHAREKEVGKYDHFVFSYHGLPRRQIKTADQQGTCLQEGCCDQLNPENQSCYRAHCFATTRLIANALSLDEEDCTLSFQSRLGPEQWLQPYTSEVLEELAGDGKNRVLVFCPAFVADCLETTIEIMYEYREEFLENGGEELDLVKSLNDDPAWISAVAQKIERETVHF